MKKKIIFGIMTAFMIGILAGCGNAPDDPDVTVAAADEDERDGEGGNTDPVPSNEVKPDNEEKTSEDKPAEDPFDRSRLSEEYLIGFDYFTGDFLEDAPTVIARIRYDGRIEVQFDYKLANGEDYADVRYFDLSEEQYKNIEEGIDLKKLYSLDPEESDPAETMDGGCSWLIIYDKAGNVYKTCGGFCPHNREFNDMRCVIYDNLPFEFIDYCNTYKSFWQQGEIFDPYAADVDEYNAKYGVFLNYEGSLDALSDYNYIVIDAQYRTREEITSFNSGDRKYVYSYINIGSLEDFRDYYDEYCDLALGEYENWDGEEWIDVSDERWQNFILNELAPSLLSKGIDGFFVDNCDVFYNYESQEILNGLAVIMKGLRSMGCDVIINGGDYFLNAYCSYLGSWRDVITGINQESVFSRIDWDTGALTYAYDDDREYFKEYIERYGDQGASIFLLEYLDDVPQYYSLRSDIKAYCEEHNYMYYISDSIDLG